MNLGTIIITSSIQVHFRFPETSSLTPPILGLYNIDFHYEDQPHLFKGVSDQHLLCSMHFSVFVNNFIFSNSSG